MTVLACCTKIVHNNARQLDGGIVRIDSTARLREETEQGTERKLRTLGDKWSYLQRCKFGANAQPFYVPVDGEGMPLAGSYSYNEDVPAYINFLEEGLKNYKK